uniref:39S ribosomal protein L46, mitochondrial n=1 Tax=Gasterosteus aculeatus aculeatus TaxID=481459 RepID=UPI001A98A32F|nr:39S ribosomal protein L46, mitochondrial [Gasterosteus aculeatus aculeatus]
MSAPGRRMASVTLSHFRSCFSRTAVGSAGFRHLSSTSVCRVTLQTKSGTEKPSSPWTLMAAVCLQRLPVISADCSPIEQQFRQMMQRMELEKSLLSDHELRLLEDSERISRKQADDYDSDEEENRGDQEIVLAQDLEDSWEQKLQKFQPGLRVNADADEDLTSLERCLADPLVLVAEQQVGGDKLWLLPQTRWQEGETLRQTAERALASLPAAGLKATFLGNAPCGVYKYKLPKAARTESAVGTKVFFFKAILSDGGAPAAPSASLLWAKKSELQRYLKPAYMMKVERFVLAL